MIIFLRFFFSECLLFFSFIYNWLEMFFLKVLNLIVEDLFQGHPVSKRKLKELLGHTPSQVVAGAVLGILVASICCQGCFHVIWSQFYVLFLVYSWIVYKIIDKLFHYNPKKIVAKQKFVVVGILGVKVIE